jgi:aspartyl-tRNA(Asn)/glutamyl-tRNA(Gln) amidotransferase subunit C
MKLTPDQVKKVATLANLPITSDEETLYADQLSKILDYIDLLNSVDTADVQPTFNVTGKTNIQSTDEVIPSLSQDEALQNAVSQRDGYFVTKGVFEEE